MQFAGCDGNAGLVMLITLKSLGISKIADNFGHGNGRLAQNCVAVILAYEWKAKEGFLVTFASLRQSSCKKRHLRFRPGSPFWRLAASLARI